MSNSYFTTLNYTLANEDTALELQVLPKNAQKVLSVVGSGARALALLINNPKHLLCVDVVPQQILLAKLREACFKQLSHNEFLLLWGYPPFHGKGIATQRKEVFLKLTLPEEVKIFCGQFLASLKWESPLLTGKWERTIQKVSLVARAILGRQVLEELFEQTNVEDQFKFFKEKISKARLKMFTYAVGNATFFNSLLYKGHFPKHNIEKSQAEHYETAFGALLSRGIARQNYFLQLCFLGELRFPEGNPVECSAENFHRVKESTTEVSYYESGLIEFAMQQSNVNFSSISDVPSYFAGAEEKNYLKSLYHVTAENGYVLQRSYLRVPEHGGNPFENVTQEFVSSIEQEKTQMYEVEIFQKKLR
jgi:S-adenosylmethionine-diacylglycerol 3-amino-3-carboxypropyl transferase